MQYALMFYAEPGYGEALPEAKREAVRADFLALALTESATAQKEICQ